MMHVKRKSLLSLPWSVAAALLIALANTSCSDRPAPLPGGYFIFVVNSSEMILNEPKYGGNIPELGRDLQQIGHHAEYIFGRNGGARRTTPGFFLLNTKTGAIKTGLTESNWLALTIEAGIPNPPKLVSPLRQEPVKR